MFFSMTLSDFKVKNKKTHGIEPNHTHLKKLGLAKRCLTSYKDLKVTFETIFGTPATSQMIKIIRNKVSPH